MKKLILLSCLLLTAISIYAGVGVLYSLMSSDPTSDKPQNVPLDGRGGGYIAFQSERDGPNEALYVMNADGTAQTRLTNNTGRNVCPAFSPDGKLIAFSSNRTGDYEIYVISRDGSDEWRLTNSPNYDLHPSWSPDGSKIAFISSRDGNLEIYTMNSDGSNQNRITNNTWNDENPDWSPDGNRILFCSQVSGNYGIYIMDTTGQNIQVILNGSLWEMLPMWSPDGTKIVFTKLLNWNSQRDIWLMNADGSNQAQLTTAPTIEENASWSPDGTALVYQSDRDGSYQLFLMNPDGSDQRKLSTSQGDYWPSWGRDTTEMGINDDRTLRRGFQLYQNYPNPFNPATRIYFEIIKQGFVSLKIYNLFGQEVDELINKHMPKGLHSVVWNSKNLLGGIYYYRLTNNLGSDTKKMVKTEGFKL